MNDTALNPLYSIDIEKNTSSLDFLELHVNFSYYETDNLDMIVEPPEKESKDESSYLFTYWTKKDYGKNRTEYSLNCKTDENDRSLCTHTFRIHQPVRRKTLFELSIDALEKSIFFDTISLGHTLQLTWKPIDPYQEIIEYTITCGDQIITTTKTSCEIQNEANFINNTVYIAAKNKATKIQVINSLLIQTP